LESKAAIFESKIKGNSAKDEKGQSMHSVPSSI
jgi:hypothetical protein